MGIVVLGVHEVLRIYNRDVSRAVALYVYFRGLVEMGEVKAWSYIGRGLAVDILAVVC